MTSYRKPLPAITPDNRPFWTGAQQHRLTMQRCDACGELRFPPVASCWHCLSPSATWVDLSGRGKVWSFILMYQLYYEGFRDEIPYPVAVIELEEGPRILSNLVDVANEEIVIGREVEVVFEEVTPEITLPKFRPRSLT